MKKNHKSNPANNNPFFSFVTNVCTDAFNNPQPYTPNVAHAIYVIEKLKEIVLNELQGNEPLNLSDVTIPWETNEEAMKHITFFPIDELDALAKADAYAGKELPQEITSDPTDYIEAVTNRYFKPGKEQFDFLYFYQSILKGIKEYIKEFKVPIPDDWVVDYFSSEQLQKMGGKEERFLPSKYRFQPSKNCSCISMDNETGNKLIQMCLFQLFDLFGMIMFHSYVTYYAAYAIEAKCAVEEALEATDTVALESPADGVLEPPADEAA